MAQIDWTQTDFDNFYSPIAARVPSDHPEHGNVYPYGWKYFSYGSRRAINGNTEEIGYADNFRWITALVDRSVYTPGNKTLIVGCGIGATVYKALYQYPNASIWGTDISAYIHSIKDTDVPMMSDGNTPFDTSRILNVDITSPTALTQLKSGGIGGNGKVGVVICELVTETIPIADRPAWFSACDSLLSQNGIVAHIIISQKNNQAIPPDWQTANWTWQSISEWGLEAPTHYFIDASQPDTVFYTPV